MTDTETEETRLQREISERQERLDELTAPMTPSEAAELARSDPDEFNRRLDACTAAGKPYLKEDDQ